MNKNPIPDMLIPKTTLSFVFDQIALSLEAHQYRDLLDTLDNFSHYNAYQKVSKHSEFLGGSELIRL